MTSPLPISYYGTQDPPAEVRYLRAGPLSMVYENGFIRYVSLGGVEILRMIYFAIRDHNWDTMPTEILNEEIQAEEDHFKLSYDCICNTSTVKFSWQCELMGSKQGVLRFRIQGTAKNQFRKNRVGFCVLHPPETCAGQPCEIIHPDGSRLEGTFPVHISPHQPFFNIQGMKWPAGKWGTAVLAFEGDVFEMEDQRNWTDASYKTYCTPLELPFPVELKAGSTVEQLVELSLEGGPFPIPSLAPQAPSLTVDSSRGGRPLPALGVGRSSLRASFSDSEKEALGRLPFHHYRVELRVEAPDWKDEFEQALAEAQELGWQLELVVFFGEDLETCLAALVETLAPVEALVSSLTILHESAKSTPEALTEEVLESLREVLPGTALGAGTNAYFTELNRERPSPRGLDFLAYSLNPQVHAFDHASLIETLATQAYTVATANTFAEQAAIHVSPVTLAPRFNPNATGPEPEPAAGEFPTRYDARQLSLFGAGWTLGSVKYLAQAGAAQVTFHETLGMYGLLQGDQLPEGLEDRYPAAKGQVFPLYMLFRFLLEWQEASLIPVASHAPLIVEALCLKLEGRHLLMAANFTPIGQQVNIKGISLPPKVRQWTLEDANYAHLAEVASTPLKDLLQPHSVSGSALELPPCGLVFMEF